MKWPQYYLEFIQLSLFSYQLYRKPNLCDELAEYVKHHFYEWSSKLVM